MRLALLIDAENLTPAHAPALLKMAGERGALPIRRAYGHAEKAKGWLDIAGVNFHHVPSAKNSADMAICVAAMDLLHRDLANGIVLATSDRDFSVLALHLRERGVPVFVYGEAKTRQELRAACTQFCALRPVTSNQPVASKKTTPEDVTRQVIAESNPCPLSKVNERIRKKLPNFRVADLGRKNLRAYFKANSDHYVLVEQNGETYIKLAS